MDLLSIFKKKKADCPPPPVPTTTKLIPGVSTAQVPGNYFYLFVIFQHFSKFLLFCGLQSFLVAVL